MKYIWAKELQYFKKNVIIVLKLFSACVYFVYITTSTIQVLFENIFKFNFVLDQNCRCLKNYLHKNSNINDYKFIEFNMQVRTFKCDII